MGVSTSVRTAVVPAAGLGTRFLPTTKAVPKELLPVVDTPAIEYVAAEAAQAVGPEATVHVVDVLDRAAVRAEIAKAMSGHGQIDVLVNVVRGSHWSLSAETSDESMPPLNATSTRSKPHLRI